MTLRVALVIDGDASGARDALEQTKSGIDKLKGSSDEVATKARDAAMLSEKAGAAMGGVSKQAQAAGGAIDGMNLPTTYLLRNFSEMTNMLLSGRSPFTVLLTQGMQITRVFGPDVGVGAAIKGLGGVLAQFLSSPLQLVTVGLAAAAGAAKLLYSTIGDNSDRLESALKEHKDLIAGIAGAYKDAVSGAENYGRTSVAVLRFQAQQNVRTLEAEFRESAVAFPMLNERQFTTGQGLFQSVHEAGPFLDAIKEFNQSVREGRPDVITFRNAISDIATALPEGSPAIKTAQAIYDAVKDVADAQADLAQARDALKGLQGDAAAATDALGPLPGQFGAAGQAAGNAAEGIARFRSEIDALAGSGGPIGIPQPQRGTLPAQFAAGGVVDSPTLFRFGGNRLGLMGEAGPEAILPLSGAGVGAIGPDGQEFALPLARLASGALGVQAFAAGGVTTRRGGGALQAVTSGVSGLAQELIKGVKPAEAFGNALVRLTDRLLDLAIQNLLMGSSKTGFDGLFGLLGSSLGFASGGAFGRSGTPMPVPSAPRARSIMPPAVAGGGTGGGMMVSMPVSISADGADRHQLRRVELELHALRQQVPGLAIRAYREMVSRRT